MKHFFILLTVIVPNIVSVRTSAQTNNAGALANTVQDRKVFIDVHHLQAGKINFNDVANAHRKDLAVEKKYGVDFLKFWVDEKKGIVYCLSSAPDSESMMNTHREAHGLLPTEIYQVAAGDASVSKSTKDFFLDIHELGPGNISAKDVAEAHKKDLETQKKYGVNFINYWVDEKKGVVICLSQAKDSASVIQTHKEAHGLLPDRILKVKQGE
jgi:hypothetical protein